MVFTNKNSFSKTTMRANNYQKFRLGSTFVREVEGKGLFWTGNILFLEERSDYECSL